MNIKRMSLRFNLNNKADRKAWEHLKNAADSKTRQLLLLSINFMSHPQKLQRLLERLFESACKIFL